jgi:uncharacterized protein with PQ loop repeat
MLVIIPYSATGISLFARFIFMYLLYTKKSTNNLSLVFCVLNIASSILWIFYCIEIDNQPLLVRSGMDVILFSISSAYIIKNKRNEIGMITPVNSNEMLNP